MSTRRALVFSFLDRYASLALSIGSSMVIARLLTPAEIGVFSVTMVLMTVVVSLRDLGAGQYLIQEKELTPERLRAAWSVSMGTGLLAGLIVLIAAKPVALFYNEPRMFNIMLVIAANFAINPFGSLTYAWLMREMRFDALAMMRFSANLAGACTTIYLAWLEWGSISLALGTLLSTVVNGVVASFFRPAGFPLRPGLVGIRKVVSVGSKFSAHGLLGALGGSVAEVLLGKLQSLANAAMYSRANGLGSMFQRLVLDATNVVAIPMFAREARDARGDINESFLRTVSYTTALGWSFFIGLALLAFPAIRLLYGSQWDAATTATRLVAFGYIVGTTSAMCPTVLMATGRPGVMVKVTAITVAFQIFAISIGASIGLDATAMALVAAYLFGSTLWLRAAQRALRFEWSALGFVLLRSGAVASITAIAPVAAVIIFGWEPEVRLAPLALALVGGLALLVASVYVVGHPLHAELSKVWGQRPWRHA
jgi:O-antigen/teichoic acid export membrane protein